MEKIYRVQLNSKGAPNYSTAKEVVRCKDCKHYGFTDNRVSEEQVWWCYKWSREMKENDFCSYGESGGE